jgi:hypothetical protein
MRENCKHIRNRRACLSFKSTQPQPRAKHTTNEYQANSTPRIARICQSTRAIRSEGILTTSACDSNYIRVLRIILSTKFHGSFIDTIRRVPQRMPCDQGAVSCLSGPGSLRFPCEVPEIQRRFEAVPWPRVPPSNGCSGLNVLYLYLQSP